MSKTNIRDLLPEPAAPKPRAATHRTVSIPLDTYALLDEIAREGRCSLGAAATAAITLAHGEMFNSKEK